MASDPNFQGYINTFGYRWGNGEALLTIDGASSSAPFLLPDHTLGHANLILYIRETCNLINASPEIADREWPLSPPATIRCYEEIINLQFLLRSSQSWRQILAAISSIPSLPFVAAVYFLHQILIKIRYFVNGWHATSVVLSVQVCTNLLTRDYLAIMAERLPLELRASDEVIARHLMVYEFVGNGDECSICLNELRNGEMVGRLPCMHIFHSNCITRWLRVRNNCPFCRYELPRN